MLKNKLTVLLMLAVLTAGAFAQSIPSGTGRIEALGNSPFVMDAATDINNNPAWNNYYQNYAFGDLGRNVISDFELSSQYAGATFNVSKQWNLGLILNREDGMFSAFNVDSTYFTNQGIQSPIVPTKLLIGYSAKKDFHIGLAPYIAMWSRKTTSSDTNIGNTDRSSRRFGATLGFLKMVKKGWFEVAIDFGMNKYKNTSTVGSTTATTENNGGMEISVGARGWIYPKTSSRIAVVPILGFNMYSWDPKQTVGSTTVTGLKNSWMSFNGGVGLNWPVNDDIQIAGGITAGYSSFKRDSNSVEVKNTVLMAPGFNFACETAIADWLTGRLGYSRTVNSDKTTETFTSGGTTSTSEISELVASSPVNTISLGAGFHFGRFSIDATVSERWLKQGINFVSGQATDLFGVISASYNFAK